MPKEFTQTGAGMAMMVERLEPALKSMVGKNKALPRIVFTDRGPGFYQGSTGHIVKKYQDALKRHGFRPYAGADASAQPADIPDCLPHETAVAWARNFMKKRPMSKQGGVEKMAKRLPYLLDSAADHINKNYDVKGLCSGTFMARLRELKDGKGERLPH